MQKEFDDLMRSSATMKVSLTPDRLKTMEVPIFSMLSQPFEKKKKTGVQTREGPTE